VLRGYLTADMRIEEDRGGEELWGLTRGYVVNLGESCDIKSEELQRCLPGYIY